MRKVRAIPLSDGRDVMGEIKQIPTSTCVVVLNRPSLKPE